MQTKHLESCVLILIAVLLVAICVYTPNNINNIPFDKGVNSLRAILKSDAYENSKENS